MCAGAAAGYGATPVLARLGYDAGATPTGLLSLRFALATGILAAVVLATGRRAERRAVTSALTLGALCFAPAAILFFAAVDRIDPSVAALIAYSYPAIVWCAAVAAGWERPAAGTVLALLLALGGVALVSAGGGLGSIDPVGVLLAFGSAVAFAAYVLASTRAGRGGADPLVLATATCAGAAVIAGAAAAVSGSATLPAPPEVVASAVALAVVCTAAPVALLVAGLSRVGPTVASTVGATEPFVAVVLSAVVLGLVPAPAQIVGGVAIVAAVLLIVRRGAAPAGEPVVPPAGRG